MASNDRRTRILQATFELIAEHGVRGLRLEDVAQRADVALSLIYYHFGNRIDLLSEVFRSTSELSTSTQLDLSSGSNTLERLERSLVKELEGKRARTNAVVWNEINASAVFMPEIRDDVRQTTTTWVQGIEAAIEAGQRYGSVRPDINPQDEAQVLAHLLDGLLTQWLLGAISASRAQKLMRQVIHQHLAPIDQ